MTPQPTYNDRLRALRQRLGLTQTEMAERFRVHKKTIRNYEAGKTIPGPVQYLLELAEAGKIRLD